MCVEDVDAYEDEADEAEAMVDSFVAFEAGYKAATAEHSDLHLRQYSVDAVVAAAEHIKLCDGEDIVAAARSIYDFLNEKVEGDA